MRAMAKWEFNPRRDFSARLANLKPLEFTAGTFNCFQWKSGFDGTRVFEAAVGASVHRVLGCPTRRNSRLAIIYQTGDVFTVSVAVCCEMRILVFVFFIVIIFFLGRTCCSEGEPCNPGEVTLGNLPQ